MRRTKLKEGKIFVPLIIYHITLSFPSGSQRLLLRSKLFRPELHPVQHGDQLRYAGSFPPNLCGDFPPECAFVGRIEYNDMNVPLCCAH